MLPCGSGIERGCPHVQAELDSILKDYVGRESPLYHAERLSEQYRRCASCITSFKALQGALAVIYTTLHRWRWWHSSGCSNRKLISASSSTSVVNYYFLPHMPGVSSSTLDQFWVMQLLFPGCCQESMQLFCIDIMSQMRNRISPREHAAVLYLTSWVKREAERKIKNLSQ